MTSAGECSVSTSTQSKPASASISVTTGPGIVFQMPVWSRPALSAALKAFRGNSIAVPFQPVRSVDSRRTASRYPSTPQPAITASARAET